MKRIIENKTKEKEEEEESPLSLKESTPISSSKAGKELVCLY